MYIDNKGPNVLHTLKVERMKYVWALIFNEGPILQHFNVKIIIEIIIPFVKTNFVHKNSYTDKILK